MEMLQKLLSQSFNSNLAKEMLAHKGNFLHTFTATKRGLLPRSLTSATFSINIVLVASSKESAIQIVDGSLSKVKLLESTPQGLPRT